MSEGLSQEPETFSKEEVRWSLILVWVYIVGKGFTGSERFCSSNFHPKYEFLGGNVWRCSKSNFLGYANGAGAFFWDRGKILILVDNVWSSNWRQRLPLFTKLDFAAHQIQLLGTFCLAQTVMYDTRNRNFNRHSIVNLHFFRWQSYKWPHMRMSMRFQLAHR